VDPVPHPWEAKWAVVGEAPGTTELIEGQYFAGASGKVLWRAVLKNQLVDPYINNALKCKAPKNMSAKDWRQAILCCGPRLYEELKDSGATHILAAGKRAFHSLCAPWTHHNPWLGAPIESDKIQGVTVIPTIHPAFCLRGKRQYLQVFEAHLVRAGRLAVGKEAPFKWQTLHYFGKSPTSNKLIRALESIASGKRRKSVGMDIETAGLDAFAPITAIGLGTIDTVVCVPWPVEEYYPKTGGRIRELIAEILRKPKLKLIAHNGVHDIMGLEREGFKVAGYTHDTLLMHHVIHPSLRHSLGFVSQNEFSCDPWKIIFKVSGDEKGSARFTKAPKEDLTYQALLRKSLIALEMKRYGAKANPKAIVKHQRNLIRNAKRALDGLNDVIGRTKFDREQYPVFKPYSNAQLRHLFFDNLGVVPIAYSQKTGEPSLRGDHLELLAGSSNSDIRQAARLLLRYRKYGKLYRTYIKGVGRASARDGYIHATAKVWGTKTGRWAYEDNLQTMPHALRDIVTTRFGDEGYIMSADYAQLEVRIMAVLSNDKPLLSWFAEGIDVHARNAMDLFGVKDPKALQEAQWKRLRKLAKAFIFAILYGAEAETIWKQLVYMFPEITLSNIQKLIDLWYLYHPAIRSWQGDQLRIARKFDHSECPLSGRRTKFFGDVEPNKVYNFPIQGSASDIIDGAIPGVFKDLKKQGDYLLFQVHDELVCDTKDPVACALVLKEHMEREISFPNGVTTKFPIDFKLGRTWGSCPDKKATREEAFIRGYAVECGSIEDIEELLDSTKEKKENNQ
jgi:DNA polymerase-1